MPLTFDFEEPDIARLTAALLAGRVSQHQSLAAGGRNFDEEAETTEQEEDGHHHHLSL